MKRLFPVLFLTLPLLAFSQSDIRVVGGIRVDLQPIHDWKQTKEGDRPMQHWKDAEVMQILRPLFGGRECIVRVDDRTQTIVIMHLPKRLLDMDAAQGKRLKKLKNLEGELEKAKAHAQETHDQSRRTYSDRDRIRDVNAGAEVRNVTNRIRELQEESSKAELFLSTLREVLIMDTGREISGKAVWEFGQTFSLGKF